MLLGKTLVILSDAGSFVVVKSINLLFLADVVLLQEGAGHFHLNLMASSEERAERGAAAA